MQAASTWLYAVPTCGILGGDRVERPLPQIAGERQHVRLVHQRDMRATGRIHPDAVRSELEREPDRPLGAHARVDRALGGDLVRGALAKHATLADVRPLGVLPDHHEVVRHGVPGRGADEGALIDVEIEIEAHLQQQAAFDHPGRHIRGADRAEQDGIEAAELVQRRIRQDLAVSQVPRTAEVVVGGFQLDPRGPHHLQRLCRHLGADAVAADHRNSICHRPEMLRGDSVFTL